MSKKLIAVVGAGAGMGVNIARVFGRHDFKVALIARNRQKLETLAKELRAEGIETYIYSADASQPESLTAAFNEIKAALGAIDVLVYNAALMSASKVTELTSAEMMKHYQLNVASAMHCIREVLPDQKAKGAGTILFTGGLFGVHPNYSADYACMSIGKAALRALAYMLNSELKSSGVYAGIVDIMGVVDSNEHFAAERIAEAYWTLHVERDRVEYIFD